jgi:hypothetical protein
MVGSGGGDPFRLVIFVIKSFDVLVGFQVSDTVVNLYVVLVFLFLSD